jgi:3'-5' exoribonuclease
MIQSISNLSIGWSGELHGLATNGEVKTAKNGKSFVKFTLLDRTGSIACMRFDCDEAPPNGVAIVATGTVDEFNGLQFKVDFWQPSTRDASEFVPASDFDELDLCMGLVDFAESIEGEYGDVVRLVLSRVWPAFLRCPAALKNHHAFERGLAEHVLSMLRIADQVGTHYNFMYPGSVDEDLLLAGVFLHDIGKVVDYVEHGPADWRMSVDGELVNHMTHAVVMVHDACARIGSAPHIERQLTHMILSHHGQLDWGSPVAPKMLEAALLHYIDNMDARASMYRSSKAEPGAMTEWVRPLGGRVTKAVQ